MSENNSSPINEKRTTFSLNIPECARNPNYEHQFNFLSNNSERRYSENKNERKYVESPREGAD
ncbi:hypothetical protein KW787_01345 [Candidatus Pacearchaeota archaeon]|nr:hypothetical protein [Candidatus Pacearchaeota archaeon]